VKNNGLHFVELADAIGQRGERDVNRTGQVALAPFVRISYVDDLDIVFRAQ